jgi:phosphoenolpyruvate carboxylase
VEEIQQPDTNEEYFDSIPELLSSALLRSGTIKSLVMAYVTESGSVVTSSFGDSKLACVGLSSLLNTALTDSILNYEEEEKEEEEDDE